MRRRRYRLASCWLLTLTIALGGGAGLARQIFLTPPATLSDGFVAAMLAAFCLLMLILSFERDQCPRP